MPSITVTTQRHELTPKFKLNINFTLPNLKFTYPRVFSTIARHPLLIPRRKHFLLAAVTTGLLACSPTVSYCGALLPMLAVGGVWVVEAGLIEGERLFSGESEDSDDEDTEFEDAMESHDQTLEDSQAHPTALTSYVPTVGQYELVQRMTQMYVAEATPSRTPEQWRERDDAFVAQVANIMRWWTGPSEDSQAYFSALAQAMLESDAPMAIGPQNEEDAQLDAEEEEYETEYEGPEDSQGFLMRLADAILEDEDSETESEDEPPFEHARTRFPPIAPDASELPPPGSILERFVQRAEQRRLQHQSTIYGDPPSFIEPFNAQSPSEDSQPLLSWRDRIAARAEEARRPWGGKDSIYMAGHADGDIPLLRGEWLGRMRDALNLPTVRAEHMEEEG